MVIGEAEPIPAAIQEEEKTIISDHDDDNDDHIRRNWLLQAAEDEEEGETKQNKKSGKSRQKYRSEKKVRNKSAGVPASHSQELTFFAGEQDLHAKIIYTSFSKCSNGQEVEEKKKRRKIPLNLQHIDIDHRYDAVPGHQGWKQVVGQASRLSGRRRG